MSMQSMGEVIDNMDWPGEEPVEESKSTPVAEQCANCGTLVNFVGKQWRRPCPQCGLSITLSERYERPRETTECYACYDRGIIIYQAQVDGEIYDHAARCICRKGTSHPAKGIPAIDQVKNAPEYHVIVARNKARCEAR